MSKFNTMLALLIVLSRSVITAGAVQSLGACFTGSLLGTFSRVDVGQTKSFPEQVLDGGAGEVVDNGIQNTVQICQTEGEEKCVGHTFQGRAELRRGQRSGASVRLDPDQQLHQVAREEADGEEHHHHREEEQSSLNLCVLTQLAPLQFNDDAHGAAENHDKRNDEGKEELELVPGQVVVRFGVDHEALAVGRVGVVQRENVSRHCDGEQPESQRHARCSGDAQRVDGMVRVHHTHVPVASNSHQEDGASAAVHRQHEEKDVAHRFSEYPVEASVIVAGPERQHRDEQKICYCQVEEQDRAALPGLQVAAEDPERQTVPEASQNKLCSQK